MLNLPHLPGSADPQPRRCTSRFHITAGLLDTSLLTETRAISSRVPENRGLGNASGRTPLSRVSITEPEPGVPPKNRERTRTALSIVANHAPSLAMRRAARWLKGLTRDQSAELTSIVSWILMVHYLSVFTLSYKSADFIEYARWLFGAATTQAADLCGLVNFFTSFFVSFLCFYEAYAGWGTPKGRGAHAAYCRKAARRQIVLLLVRIGPFRFVTNAPGFLLGRKAQAQTPGVGAIHNSILRL